MKRLVKIALWMAIGAGAYMAWERWSTEVEVLDADEEGDLMASLLHPEAPEGT